MKKTGFSLIVLIIGIVIVIGVISISVVYFNKDSKKEKAGSEIEESKTITIPEECQGFGEKDSCSLFSCVVDLCWCNETGGEPYLADTGEQVTKEEDAARIVFDFLKSVDSAYIYDIRGVKLNDMFYNVFSYDKDNYENILTISFDGKILETFCGI